MNQEVVMETKNTSTSTAVLTDTIKKHEREGRYLKTELIKCGSPKVHGPTGLQGSYTSRGRRKLRAIKQGAAATRLDPVFGKPREQSCKKP